jgi:acyl CoA:acetate/3-ketoacid CoA transferase alpha subunit
VDIWSGSEMAKLRESARDALLDVVEDGITIAVGGFGLATW